MNLKDIWRQTPPVTRNLLMINVIVFLAINVFSRYNGDIMHYGALHYFSSSDFLPTQLITYMFMHEELGHLFFNMFALWMFGGVIERAFGSRRFIFYYLSCGFGAAIIQEGVYALMINHYEGLLGPFNTVEEISANGADLLREGLTYSNATLARLNMLINVPTIGASGAVYGILLAFGFLFPRQPIYLMFIPIPIPAFLMVIAYGVIELLQAMSANMDDNVAHLAHLGGMIFGLIMLLYWKHKGVINRYI